MNKKQQLMNLQKSLLILGLSTCIVGCGKKGENDFNSKSEIIEENTEKNCLHIIVNYADEKIIFKECNDYDISYSLGYSSMYIKISSNFSKDSHTIRVTNYIMYYGNDVFMQEIEQQAIEDGAKVYQLKNKYKLRKIKKSFFF